jgi:putative endonuclease
MAKHNDIGLLGEGIATKFLAKKGLKILERNHWRKWGEIDIVACDTSGILHFIEVKSTSRDYNPTGIGQTLDDWDPKEMVHSNKIKRLRRVIQTYILENDVDEWVFDVVIVYINKRTHTAKCKYIKDIVL